MSFNITVRADNRKELRKAIDAQAAGQIEAGHLPQKVKDSIDTMVDALPDIKDGYLQLTTYGHIGEPGSIVFNLSSHRND